MMGHYEAKELRVKKHPWSDKWFPDEVLDRVLLSRLSYPYEDGRKVSWEGQSFTDEQYDEVLARLGEYGWNMTYDPEALDRHTAERKEYLRVLEIMNENK